VKNEIVGSARHIEAGLKPRLRDGLKRKESWGPSECQVEEREGRNNARKGLDQNPPQRSGFIVEGLSRRSSRTRSVESPVKRRKREVVVWGWFLVGETVTGCNVRTRETLRENWPPEEGTWLSWGVSV